MISMPMTCDNWMANAFLQSHRDKMELLIVGAKTESLEKL